MSGPPRRSPYPYDTRFGTVGLMLGRGSKDEPLIITKPPDLSTVTPSDYSYSGQNPILGTVASWGDLTAGLGLSVQQTARDRRYSYAINADLSISTMWLKGPLLGSITPSVVDATNGVTHFFEIAGTLYALNGRYCQKRNTDIDWDTGRQDFGVGKAALDIAVYFTNVGGGARYAYVAMGETDPIWRFDGTTWTQHAEASKIYAIALGIVGREFYRASGTNNLAKVTTDTDPFVIANWSAANSFTVGDKSYSINRLITTNKGSGNAGLLIIKQNGIYTLNAYGDDQVLYPALQFAPISANGKGFGYWLNDVYLPFGFGFFRIRPDYRIEEIGPERLLQNNTEVMGRITAFAGHDTLHSYAGLKNDDTGDSYLLKLGAWEINPDGSAARLDTWHGSITPKFAAKTITALYKSTIGAPSGHSRLYIGFSDGTIQWFTLPCVPNPAACSQYGFSLTDGQVFLPRWHGLFHSDPKVLRSVAILSPNLSTSNYADIKYRSDTNATWSDLGHDFNVSPEEEISLPVNTSGIIFDLQVLLKNTATTASPQVTGMGLHWALRVPLQLTYEFNVIAADGLAARDGRPLNLRAAGIRNAIKQVVNTPGSILVALPDESLVNLSFLDYSEVPVWDERLRQWRSGLKVKAAEVISIVAANPTIAPIVYGTYARLELLTYGALEAYTYSGLESA